MFGQAGRPQVAQPISEHAGRHARDPCCQLTVGQAAVLQLPEHVQRPPAPEHIKQFQQRAITHDSALTSDA
jgi:hypothetical protein